MAKFPKGKWSFLGAVYLCPIARLEWNGTTCMVSPYASFFNGASVMSPYSPGTAVTATATNVYLAEGSLYLKGSFDFGAGLKGLKGSFTAEVFSDYSLALMVKYSWSGQKETSSTWYGTVDDKSLSPAWDAAGRSFLVQYMVGNIYGGVVGVSVGALKVVDVGAGWAFGYGMAAAGGGGRSRRHPSLLVGLVRRDRARDLFLLGLVEEAFSHGRAGRGAVRAQPGTTAGHSLGHLLSLADMDGLVLVDRPGAEGRLGGRRNARGTLPG